MNKVDDFFKKGITCFVVITTFLIFQEQQQTLNEFQAHGKLYEKIMIQK